MMKGYLYFSKTRISQINDINQVKRNIANDVSETLNLFDDLKPSDISIRCVKISNGFDLYFVLDKMIGAPQKEIVEKMNILKEKLREIMQKDQGRATPYNIGMKVDAMHRPEGKEYSNGDAAMSSQASIGISNSSERISELDYENRAKAYIPVEPSYSFERVILPEDVLEKIESAINILKYERKVFDEWGLYEIQPNPSSSLSFYGPSGTGKTMAAEAIAQKLGKKILKVSYADVESKYHGEGPKMVKAIFLAATREDAVLFFDEADSLLSKRLTNVTQGSEQAINSMRSQLLICLEEFRGIVIFATNLIVNYDNAFLTRLISVEFKMPDSATRKKIWDVHVRPATDGMPHKLNIPLAEDVDTQQLADTYEFAGREIRNAVISACVAAAMKQKDIVTQGDFIKACDKIVAEKAGVASASDHTISDKAKDALKQIVLGKIREDGVSHVPAQTEEGDKRGKI